jgi:hypothetical protein
MLQLVSDRGVAAVGPRHPFAFFFQKRARKAPQERGVAGVTGVDPATSGVTGRHGPTSYNRLRAGITG